jgi:hypothetical protein
MSGYWWRARLASASFSIAGPWYQRACAQRDPGDLMQAYGALQALDPDPHLASGRWYRKKPWDFELFRHEPTTTRSKVCDLRRIARIQFRHTRQQVKSIRYGQKHDNFRKRQ